jgi:hypothetical protein
MGGLDWEWSKETAFGPLNLSHDVFWKLTPGELIDLFNGWQWRENRRIDEIKATHELEMQRLSVLASWITAPHLKKPKKPTDFYDPEKSNKPKKTTTLEESQKIVDKLAKQMGVI